MFLMDEESGVRTRKGRLFASSASRARVKFKVVLVVDAKAGRTLPVRFLGITKPANPLDGKKIFPSAWVSGIIVKF